MTSLLRFLLCVCLGLLLGLPSQATTPLRKCVISGTVTFQSAPCPATGPTQEVSVEALNAERRQRKAAAAAQAPSGVALPPPSLTAPPAAARPAVPREPEFRCDGRQHCSQMRSCREAKFFLATCPGVKMDGDNDGLPCEEQWCSLPNAD